MLNARDVVSARGPGARDRDGIEIRCRVHCSGWEAIKARLPHRESSNDSWKCSANRVTSRERVNAAISCVGCGETDSYEAARRPEASGHRFVLGTVLINARTAVGEKMGKLQVAELF